jgi:plasmid maintenance system antidote protein VapI
MEMSDLLDKAKERANLISDYALAKAIGITAGNLSNIRKGRTHPSNEVAIQLATLAGMNEMMVIAEIELKTANSEKKKEFWKHYIESRGITACLAMSALAASIILTPEPAEASILHLKNYANNLTDFHAQKTADIYIMRKKKTENRLILKALFSKWIEILNCYHTAHKNYSYNH